MEDTEIRPLRFDPARNAWVEGTLATPAKPGLTIATFNVWFGEHELEARADALLDLVFAADVVALQEVTVPFLERLLAREEARRDFVLSDATGATFERYGMVLLSRVPVRGMSIHPLTSDMERALLIARLDLGGRELVVGSVHLESYRESAPVRERQLGDVFRILKPAANAAVMGDFNFCSTWEENATLDPAFVDLWPRLRKDEGWTVDSAVNTMRGALGKSDKHVRFDRILLRGPDVAPRSIELLGTSPIAPDLFPSDHFGLKAALAYS